MLKAGKEKIFLGTGLAAVFALMVFSSIAVSGEAESLPQIQEKLAGVSEEERTALESLFILGQEIEAREKEEKAIAREIEALNGEVRDLTGMISRSEAAYEQKRAVLRQVLKSYQRMGPGSYLEILLDSDSLAGFLRRLNILRDLSRNTGALLQSLEENGEKLAGEKTKLADKMRRAEESKAQLKESLTKKLRLKQDQEKYLASLKEKKEYYQNYLTAVQARWDQLKPLFPEITREFSRFIAKGDWPEDALKITISSFRIESSLDEAVLNDLVARNSRLPQMVFKFSPGKSEISWPEENLVLTGTLVILDGSILKFAPEAGSFYGLPLKTGEIEELFQEGPLVLNLGPLMGGCILESVDLRAGYIEFGIKPALFQ